MIRLSLFISLLLTPVAVLADDVLINISGEVYIPPCTINNGQNIVVDFGDINPAAVNNKDGAIEKSVSVSCPYKGGTPWIKLTGTYLSAQNNNVLKTNIDGFGIALYQGKGTATRLIFGDGTEKNGFRVLDGLDSAGVTFTFTSMPFQYGSGILNGGHFEATANMSLIYK